MIQRLPRLTVGHAGPGRTAVDAAAVVSDALPELLADRWPGAGRWDEDGWIWMWLEHTARTQKDPDFDGVPLPPALTAAWAAHLARHLEAQRAGERPPSLRTLVGRPDFVEAVQAMLAHRTAIAAERVVAWQEAMPRLHRGDVWHAAEVDRLRSGRGALPRLGIHWTQDEGIAWRFTDRDPGHDSPAPVVVAAEAAPEQVNWHATFWANLHPVYGDREQEIVLRTPAPALVLHVDACDADDVLWRIPAHDVGGMAPRAWRAGEAVRLDAEAETPAFR